VRTLVTVELGTFAQASAALAPAEGVEPPPALPPGEAEADGAAGASNIDLISAMNRE
jgi:hypothetical protein